MSENYLSQEKSLYLLQHSKNPIHWHTWKPETLETAKKLNRPVFISIGYSSCHWCHVMNHESFEDQKTADILNKNFVCIKIDREEFPDVDQFYQKVASITIGRGGWPLNIFLTPELSPYFVGTYFSKTARGQTPAFPEILNHLVDTYKTKKNEIQAHGMEVIEQVKKNVQLEKKVEFKGHFPPPQAILNALENYLDKENGGWGEAPKFPHFAFLEWGCEQILEGMIPKEQGLNIVNTIERMLMGGMYDHLRGGIHRYSTDEKYLVPHFEKMLYDQSGLLRVLSKVTNFYPSPLFYDAIIQTMDYLELEMLSEDGYFMAAQDADSEGHEGLYFTFSKEEFVLALQNEEELIGPYQKIWEEWFQITEKGNFENNLNVISLNPKYKNDFYSQDGWDIVRKIRGILLEERKNRIPPATDQKGIASWNFLLVSALCDVIQYVKVPQIAQQAVNLLNKTMEKLPPTFVKKENNKHTLAHTTTNPKTPLYFEDYVSFLDSQFRLYEVTGLEPFLVNAKETIDFVLREFMQEGQCFTTKLGQDPMNLPSPLHDQSFRSPLGTFLLTCVRASILWPEYHPEKIWGEEWKNYIQIALTNPLAHGEALKAMTYPLELIRKLEVPRSWINEPKFQEMRNHFMPRFVLTYHDRDESYQICHRDSCEQQGSGLLNFLKIFLPAKKEA